MENIINDLYDVIEKRKLENNEGSYTNYLFKNGKEKILKKVGEECTEVIIASMKNNNKEEQVNEMCDLTYHLLVLLNELNIPLEDVCTELKNRRNKINNFKGERKAIDNIWKLYIYECFNLIKRNILFERSVVYMPKKDNLGNPMQKGARRQRLHQSQNDVGNPKNLPKYKSFDGEEL